MWLTIVVIGASLFILGATIIAGAGEDLIRSRRVVLVGAIAENVGFAICLFAGIVGLLRLIQT